MATQTLMNGVPTNIIDGAAIGTITGTKYGLPAAPCMITWQILLGTAPASVTTVLQLSNDGSTWATVDTSTSTTSGRINTTYAAAPFIRANVSGVSGGTTITVVVTAKSLNGANVFGGYRVLSAQSIDVVTPADQLENTLFTATIPANTLNYAGALARLRCWGSVAADGNSKTLRLKFGTDAYVPFSGGVNNVQFFAEVLLMRRQVINTQTRCGRGWVGTSQSTIQTIALGLTETSDITVTITSQNGSSVASELTLNAAILDVQGPML